VPVTELRSFADRLAGALAADPLLGQRLGRARVSSSLTAVGADVLVRLRFQPGDVEVICEPGGVEDAAIVLGEDVLPAVSGGMLALAPALLGGGGEVRGDVRALLRIMPIIRRLLAEGGSPVASPETLGTLDGVTPDELADRTCSIVFRDLTKRFGEQEVLSGLDLEVPEGAITVVLGPSGTGKSVLLKHAIGLLQPDAGVVRINGRSLASMRRSELMRLRRRIGVLFQDGALHSSMTVADNVALPLREHTQLGEATIRRTALDRLADVGLRDAADLMPGHLSGGMRKRVGLARAMVLRPHILFFDEPDSGLDPVRTSLLSELIVRMHGEHGGTYLVITHDIALARRVADFVAVLWEGRIVERGPAPAMFASEQPFISQFVTAATDGPLGMS
jgi:phospholipid/cholesterol/gamma-HCH transport system ATP-binding protein